DVTGPLPYRTDNISQPLPELDELLLGFDSEPSHPLPGQSDPEQPFTETDDSFFGGSFFTQLLNDPVFGDPSLDSALFGPSSFELPLPQDDPGNPTPSLAGQTTGSGGTGNGLEMTLDEVDQYADLPLFSELVIDADLTGTVLEFRPPAGLDHETDGADDGARALGQGRDAEEDASTTSRTGKGKRRADASDSDSDSDPDDDTFGNRFAKTGPVMFNDWTEEGEEEQEDPELAFIWAGFQTVLEASSPHSTDIASPGIPAPDITGTSTSPVTGTGPQPHEDDPALEEVDPLEQTPQHTPQHTPGERTGAGVWQEYLDELHHLPAGVDSEGRDQAVQTLQDLITDTAFGGPFPQDIAAAHPLLLQHSPAYRTHFTAFQHTHTTRSVHHPDTDPDPGTGTERDGVTAPVPDPVLREYWTALAARPSSPPDTTSGRHTTAPGAENIPPGGPLTTGAPAGSPAAGHPQDMDIDDGPQYAGEPTPSGPPSAPHGHPHPDTGSDDGRTGNDDAMQTEDDQPHSPQAGPEELDAEVQPSAWERYLDATATLPDGPSTQQLRQLLQ
ncbi:hypothetical protein, partial [Streptomyces sp. NPDC056632]|uniref:hypothetical protein n=1 Tax=Streptomyces sp. NPDC056632 TaxID=3345884 RepID=UPI0036A81D57